MGSRHEPFRMNTGNAEYWFVYLGPQSEGTRLAENELRTKKSPLAFRDKIAVQCNADNLRERVADGRATISIRIGTDGETTFAEKSETHHCNPLSVEKAKVFRARATTQKVTRRFEKSEKVAFSGFSNFSGQPSSRPFLAYCMRAPWRPSGVPFSNSAPITCVD